MKSAVIFDLDGTLSNTLNSIAYFANKTLNQYGFSSIPTERYKLLTGNGARTLVERMMAYVGCHDADILENVLKDYNKSYDDNFLFLTEPYCGIIDMLNALKHIGIKTAVISNKPHSTTVQVVSALFGSELIDIVVGGREGIPLKPDPMAVDEVVSLLNVPKELCLYVGDTGTDMETAHNAQLSSVGVLWGFRDEAELKRFGADTIIKSPMEILKLL